MEAGVVVRRLVGIDGRKTGKSPAAKLKGKSLWTIARESVR